MLFHVSHGGKWAALIDEQRYERKEVIKMNEYIHALRHYSFIIHYIIPRGLVA